MRNFIYKFEEIWDEACFKEAQEVNSKLEWENRTDELKTGIKFFPEIKEVFINEHEKYAEHFMPIATINLSLLNKK